MGMHIDGILIAINYMWEFLPDASILEVKSNQCGDAIVVLVNDERYMYSWANDGMYHYVGDGLSGYWERMPDRRGLNY